MTDIPENSEFLASKSRRPQICSMHPSGSAELAARTIEKLLDSPTSARTLDEFGPAFKRSVALDHQRALVHAETCTKVATKARAALEKNAARRATIEEHTGEIAARKSHLEPQRTIRQLDVAQDTILTATKLPAAQLIAFTFREYLPSMPMTPQTFVQRVLSVRGRKELHRNDELVVLYEDFRDPLVNNALRDACDRINRRGFAAMADGSVLPSSRRRRDATSSIDLISHS